jgi:hypothetical protein
MTLERARLFFAAFAAFWTAIAGWLLYRYPEFFAKLNARLGFERLTGPRFIRFTKWLGIVEMACAAIFLAAEIVLTALGIDW